MAEKQENKQTEHEARMTFTEHLAELRVRIIRSGIALGICVILAYIFSEEIFHIVASPLMPDGDIPSLADFIPIAEDSERPEMRMQVLNIFEPILVYLKLAVVAGTLVALPYIVYQACAFIFPGLKPNERKAVHIILGGGSVLALAGVCVAYFGIFPLVLPFLMSWAPEGVELGLRVNENVNIILKGMLAFAVAFQFPMVVLVMVYLDLLSPETLKRYRRVAIVGLAVGAAMFTPPDPVTMVLMLLPLVLLYEGSILISYLVVRKRKKKQAEGAES